MQVAANTPWFTFSTEALLSNFKVYQFKGTESVSTAYEFCIELVCDSGNVDFMDYVGKTACLTISDRSGGKRYIHGLIREMEQLHTANIYTHYRCYLVPRLWFLTQRIDHRIYQHQTIVEIISDVLNRQGFTEDSYEFKCFTKFQPREYCVQYGETDFHFINRLCEEEGVYYYFEHSDSGHKLCFCDMPGGPAIPGESNLRFFPGSGERADTAVIDRLNFHQRVNSNAASYREWNFEKPSLHLECSDTEPEYEKAPFPAGTNLEQYQFPHLYTLQEPGGRYAQLQLFRQLTWHTWIEGETDVSRLTPSYVFSIRYHKRRQVNTKWWVVGVVHEGEQPQSLEHEAPDRGMSYKAKFTAIPEITKFMPALAHPKVRVDGLQSAIVTGPAGEEVYTDKYGRVKVQFHWDRLGQKNENTTCWVRVSDNWAGPNFGFIQLPRIGQEVLVEYMEGDPDRPVITGRVYNTANMPPWQLPEQKTLSGIQSREFKAGRRNQLVLDDTEKEIQAQLSSDHDLSQLNLGYITRVNHLEGRRDFRGEGFELRTDGWGVVRATKGLYSTTHGRVRGTEHQKSFSEGVSGVSTAVQLHKEIGELASRHKAHILDEDVETVHTRLKGQQDNITGTGEAHSELTKPHIVTASSAGIASTSIESQHHHSGGDTAITSEQNISLIAGKSFLGSFLQKICLFAHKAGIKIFAAMGMVQIQAQSDEMELVAMKDIRIVSTKEKIEIAAAKEILLTAGGSYIRISKNGIEQGTAKDWVVHAGNHKIHAQNHSMLGPKTWNRPMLDMPLTDYLRDVEIKFVDVFGRPLKNDDIAISMANAELIEATTADGIVKLKNVDANSMSLIQKNRMMKGK